MDVSYYDYYYSQYYDPCSDFSDSSDYYYYSDYDDSDQEEIYLELYELWFGDGECEDKDDCS